MFYLPFRRPCANQRHAAVLRAVGDAGNQRVHDVIP